MPAAPSPDPPGPPGSPDASRPQPISEYLKTELEVLASMLRPSAGPADPDANAPAADPAPSPDPTV